MSTVTLAATLHDPDDRQLAQTLRVLPFLQERYAALTVLASRETARRSIDTLRAAGVVVQIGAEGGGFHTLGTARADTLELALAAEPDHIHLCDWDRVIHWAEAWPEELAEVVAALPAYDFLILGRTARAFDSHPQVQRDTERLINHVFGLTWGQALDITAASRGISRAAAQRLVTLGREPSAGNDGTWPLLLARDPAWTIGYATTEGLEWETADRYADEIERVGGLDAWIAAFDADIDHWATRLQLAYIEVAALSRWHRGRERAT